MNIYQILTTNFLLYKNQSFKQNKNILTIETYMDIVIKQSLQTVICETHVKAHKSVKSSKDSIASLTE